MRLGASNPFRAAPNPNRVPGARAALNLDSECPTGMLSENAYGWPRRAGSLKRLLVVAFAPRLRQKMRCTMRRELSSAFTATCIDTLGFGQTRHAVVRVPFGSLLVPRDRYDTYWGAKNIFFLIRDIDGPAMTAASVESCRFVVLRSLGGRSGVGTRHVQAPTPPTPPLLE